MRNYYLPRKRGAHRIAAIALYRALLTQCRLLPVPASHRETLQNVVRNQFRRNVDYSSLRLLTVAFDAGYKALDTLDHVIEERSDSNGTIASFLHRVKPVLTLPAPSHGPYATRDNLERQAARPRQDETSSRPNPSSPAMAVLGRTPLPASQLKKPRQVPVLVDASGMPFLRYNKPQSPYLSRFLRQRLGMRQNRYDRLEHLVTMKGLARVEDEWDELLARPGQAVGLVQREESWTLPFSRAIERLCTVLDAEKKRLADTAASMLAIVDAERALADEERTQSRDNQGPSRKVS